MSIVVYTYLMDRIDKESGLKTEKFVRSEKIEPGSDGWLSPRGDYYKVGTTEHDESADYLIGNSQEVKEEERIRFAHAWDKKDYDEKNNREKLKQLGWILVRGDILRSEDALNFTASQLKAISEAGIKVVSAFDGSTEYSSDEVQSIVKKVQTNLDQSKVIQQLYEDIEKGDSPWFSSIREETAVRLANFKEDPFHTTIYTAEVYDWHHPKEHEVLPMEILDILSKGSSEEMKMFLGRSEYTFRVIDLKTGGKIWVEREEYFHDGLSGGSTGDYNNYISMFVVDDVLMRKRIADLIESKAGIYKRPPEITSQIKGGYFEKFFSGIIKK